MIEFDDVVAYLGKPNKQDCKHAYWQCPECKDKGKDNLIYTFYNQILKSWCCESCKKIYGDIVNNNPNKYQGKENKPKPKPEISHEKLESMLLYWCECQETLLGSQRILDYLEEKRGINKQTVEFCGIGIDINKKFGNHSYKVWVLPIIDANNHTLIGFEYRKNNFSIFYDNIKCMKEPGSYSCLSEINPGFNSKKQIILEGFLDAYLFLQHYGHEKYHILTPSMGVHSILPLMDSWYNKNLFLYLDSDKAGIEVMNKCKEKYQDIQIKTLQCGCKDFGDHYLKCLNRGKNGK